jgi:hypothetical protein
MGVTSKGPPGEGFAKECLTIKGLLIGSLGSANPRFSSTALSVHCDLDLGDDLLGDDLLGKRYMICKSF